MWCVPGGLTGFCVSLVFFLEASEQRAFPLFYAFLALELGTFPSLCDLLYPATFDGVEDVLPRRDIAQVLGAIVVANPIDVVDQAFGIATIYHLPDETMHGTIMAGYAQPNIAGLVPVACWCAGDALVP